VSSTVLPTGWILSRQQNQPQRTRRHGDDQDCLLIRKALRKRKHRPKRHFRCR
jgi:hypothetical protein